MVRRGAVLVMADPNITVPLEYSSDPQKMKISEATKGYQTELIDPKTVFEKKLREKAGEPGEPGGPFSAEWAELYEEAYNIALDNKLEIIGETVGETVVNSDWSNLKDAALLWKLSRSKSFKMRKKKFKEYYPEGKFVRNQVTIGDRTLDLEMYKYDKSDPEFRLVDPFGMEYSDFAVFAGHMLDEQLLGEGLGLFAGTALSFLPGVNPTTGLMVGSWLGIKARKANEALMGYGEQEFAEKGFDTSQFFTDTDDLLMAGISGGFYKLTKVIGDRLFLGTRPGTINLTEEIVNAADKLGLDPLVFAQLAVNPQIRNIFTQAEGFTSFVPGTRQSQIDSIIKSFKKNEKLFEKLDVKMIGDKIKIGDQTINIQDLINAQTHIANQVKKHLKVNFGIKDGFIDMADADKALAGVIKNFNLVNGKFQNNYLGKVIKTMQANEDGFVNIRGFKQTVTREINKLLSGITTKEGEVLKTSYKSLDDLPKNLKKIVENLKEISSTINVVKDPSFLNLKTLYKMRKDLYELMHHADPNINLAAAAMHKNLAKLLNPKNGYWGKTSDLDSALVANLKILNGQVENAEVVNGMNMIREAFIKGNDLDGFVTTMIKPGNTNNISAIKEMLRLPDDASQADKIVSQKFFDTVKNYWIASTVKSNNGSKILNDFLLNDKKSLQVLLGPNYEQKALELQNLIKLQNKVEQGIIGQSISTKATSAEFMDKLIKNASEGKFGASDSMDELILDLGGFDSLVVNDIRNNIMKNLFKNSLKIEDKPGKKMLQEVLDAKKFADNVQKLRENVNLRKFFNNDQFQALTSFEQYSRAVGGNLGVGGELAKAEQTSKLVQKFQLVDTGLTILKYDILARLLSKPITARFLKDLTMDGINPANIKILMTALTKMEGELYEDARGKNKLDDEGIIDEYKVTPEVDETSRMAPTPNISFDQPPVVPESRMAQANPVGMIGTPTGGIDPNRAALAFGPGDILAQQRPQYAAQGGIMSTNKAFQRVA